MLTGLHSSVGRYLNGIEGGGRSSNPHSSIYETRYTVVSSLKLALLLSILVLSSMSLPVALHWDGSAE